jgi:hypothetical protein
MSEAGSQAKLVERQLPRVGARSFPFGLSWGEFVAMLSIGVVFLVFMLVRSDSSTILLTFLGICVLAILFLVPVNRVGERAIHLVPRYASFLGRLVNGNIDVHFREIEGRHFSHRTVTTDFPMSKHLGDHLSLSSFDWRGRSIGLIIEGGTRLRPWKASYLVVVQVSGRDQLPLESAEYQETLLRRWNTALNTLSKQDLGLSALQELMLSRPLVEGEGAHWDFDDLLEEQAPELAEQYRQVQLLHDATGTDRRMFLVLRSGGTFGAWMKARHYGSNRVGVEEHFRNVLGRLSAVLQQATLNLVRTMDVDQLNALLRLVLDPTFAPAVGYREAERSVHSVGTHVAPIEQWDEHHSYLVVNGVYTSTYRVIGWPHRVIGPAFLSGALLNHQGGLRVSVVMAPEDPKTSVYVTRAGMTNAAGKAERRSQKGTVTTEQERLVDSQPAVRDAEMAHGHHPIMFGVYFTVIADDRDSLRRAADDLATQCDAVGVDIGCCHGWQSRAYTNTLPFCRGV